MDFSKSMQFNQKKVENLVFLAAITIIGLLARHYLFPIESGDYHQFLLPWYNQLYDNGGFAAVGMDIGDYMPTYYYILAFLTYLPFEPLTGIKIVSCIADIILAVIIYKIVFHVTKNENRSIAAYGIVIFLPSVLLNSAAWAQCDGIFTLFIAASILFILKGKDWGAMICFSIAFVFKIQAIFFAPVLLILYLKNKLRWRTVLAFPAVYVISIIPALVTGGNFLDLITVYFRQSKQYSLLNMYIQNAWGLLFEVRSKELAAAGVMFAGGVVLIALFWIYRTKFEINDSIIITLSALFTLLVPFVLPHMHERYYYLATVISVIFAVVQPRRIWTLLIMEFCLFQAEAHNLFGKDAMDFNFSVLLVAFVLVTYFKTLYDQMHIPSINGSVKKVKK